MRLGALVLLWFGVGLVLYFMGSAPLINIFQIHGKDILLIAGCEGGDLFCTSNATVIGAILLSIVLAGGLAALFGGFSAMYVIPIIILVGVLNFFIFPLDFLMHAPDFIQFPLIALNNILTALAVTNFIRGGV